MQAEENETFELIDFKNNPERWLCFHLNFEDKEFWTKWIKDLKDLDHSAAATSTDQAAWQSRPETSRFYENTVAMQLDIQQPTERVHWVAEPSRHSARWQ